MYCH